MSWASTSMRGGIDVRMENETTRLGCRIRRCHHLDIRVQLRARRKVIRWRLIWRSWALLKKRSQSHRHTQRTTSSVRTLHARHTIYIESHDTQYHFFLHRNLRKFWTVSTSTYIGNVAFADRHGPIRCSILAVALTTRSARGLVPHFRPRTKAWLCYTT